MKPLTRVLLKMGLGAASLAVCGVALAHAYLQGSEPPANAVLARPPSEIRLRFSEPLEPGFIDLKVLRNGQALAEAASAKLAKDGKTLQVDLGKSADPPAGDYEVQWRIVAKDGHPTKGRFTFRVGAR